MLSHRSGPLRCVLAAVAFALAPVARANGPIGDAPVFARIDALRPVASGIVIDGSGADWGAIPALPDPAGDAGGDGSRDIVSAAIAPLADALLVRIETASAPSTGDLSFWLYVDFAGQETIELEIGLYAGFDDILWSRPEGGDWSFQYWSDTTLAIGNVVEVRVPYALLAPALPASLAQALTGPDARPFVRVTPFTRDYGQPGVPTVDVGPAVASYRFVPTPYALDSGLPSGAETALPMPPALDGLWYVSQGAFGLGTHAGTWAYDFSSVDGTLSPSAPPSSPNLGDYPAFGRTVRAPVAGTVYSTASTNPDLPPNGVVSSPANFVYLDAGNDVGLLLTHLRQASVAVSPAQSVIPGQALGQVGHSGSGSWPHLHLGAETFLAGPPGLPIAHTEVEVGLNPVADDPWRRWLPSWAVREGYFVRPAGALCGDVTVDETLAAADVSALRARLANPSGSPLGTEGERRCTVIAPARPCDVLDVAVLRRALAQPKLAPGVAQVCLAALGP